MSANDLKKSQERAGTKSLEQILAVVDMAERQARLIDSRYSPTVANHLSKAITSFTAAVQVLESEGKGHEWPELLELFNELMGEGLRAIDAMTGRKP